MFSSEPVNQHLLELKKDCREDTVVCVHTSVGKGKNQPFDEIAFIYFFLHT